MSKDKKKITYIDDGRTIADMSGLQSSIKMSKSHSSSTAKEKWKTYWGATRMMLLPTLIAVGFLVVTFLFFYLIFYLL